MRIFVAATKAIILVPFYFGVLTLFGLWPWSAGAPWALLTTMRIPAEARNTAILRLLAHRLLLRDERLLRKDVRITLDAYRLKRWIRSPWFVTLRSCARFAVSDLERRNQLSVRNAIELYCRSLVDSYRYANGTVHRDWFDAERRHDGAFHLPNEHHIRVCCYLLNHKMNPEMSPDQRHFDKAEFHRICEQNGLPTVPVYAVFRDGRIETTGRTPGPTMISKPADMAEGNGKFIRWILDDSGNDQVYKGSGGQSMSVEELLDSLAGTSMSGPYLLQSAVVNHSAIREMSGSKTLCTLRVPTCRFSDGKVSVLPFAFVRMPTDTEVIVDNMTLGSVAFPVDLETGCFKAGGKFGETTRYRSHPVTGVEVLGKALPYWFESVDLCTRAHATAFSTYATIGWDVAITDKGPLLLEMNIQWVRPVGLPDEPFSGQSEYVDCILSHMEDFWPDQLPDQ